MSGMQDFWAYVAHAKITIKDERLLATLNQLVNSWPTNLSVQIFSTLKDGRAVIAARLATDSGATTAEIWDTEDTLAKRGDFRGDINNLNMAINQVLRIDD